MEPPTPDEAWYVDAFRSDYRVVYPHRDVESAEREIRWVLEQGFGGRVLDLCCGYGRHCLALARAGVDVVGLDLSAELLRDASRLEGAERLAGRLFRGDMRRLPFAEGTFDGVLNLFSSFGYVGDDGDLEVLDEIARVLAPGGRGLLDLMNPARIRADLVPESTTERDGLRLVERRALVDGGRRVTKEVHLTLPGGAERRWREEVRMYETEELEHLLGERGLRVTAVHGGFGGGAYGPEADRQIVQIRRG